MTKGVRNTILIVVGVLVVGFIILQLIPPTAISAEFARENPPVQTTIQWNSAQTEALMRGACMDCHSNETRWPWYAQIAPVSWLVAKDVNEGRAAMNISTGGEVEGGEMIDEIEEGGMPLPIYLPMHAEARLSDADKEALLAGIAATFGTEGGGERGEAGEGDDDND